MIGKGPGSNAASRSSSAARCEALAIRPRIASRVPTLSSRQRSGRSLQLPTVQASAFFELELLVDHLLEEVVRLRAADHAAVDEEGRRAVDARFLAVLDVGVDLRLQLVRIDARVELCSVQPKLGGALFQIRVAEL